MNMNDIAAGLNGIGQKIDSLDNDTRIKLREFQDEILSLKQRGAGSSMPGEFTGARNSLGAQLVTRLAENRDIFSKTRSLSLSLETKSLLGSFTGANTASNTLVQSHGNVSSLAIDGPREPLTLAEVMPFRAVAGLTTGHYSRFGGSGGPTPDNFVQAGEGAEKSETNPRFTPVAQNAVTVAAYANISEQALNSTGELQSVVDGFLRQEIMAGIDRLLIGGTAVTSWPFAGLKTLASPYPSATYTTLADTIAEVVAHMRWSGLRPNVVVLNPMGYLALVLAKNLGGDYLTGGYLADVALTAHGCRVVFSSSIDVNKALILDTSNIELIYSDALNVQLGYLNDNFRRNVITVRAECAVIPVYRHYEAAYLATPKPA